MQQNPQSTAVKESRIHHVMGRKMMFSLLKVKLLVNTTEWNDVILLFLFFFLLGGLRVVED